MLYGPGRRILAACGESRKARTLAVADVRSIIPVSLRRRIHGLICICDFHSRNSAGRDLLFQLEAEFAQAVAKDGAAAFVSYMAEDGVELDDGGGISTREDMRKQDAWPAGPSLTWKPLKADMSASGDLGYTYGTFVFKSKNKDGQPTTHYG